MAFIYAGDVDYYKLQFDAAHAPFDLAAAGSIPVTTTAAAKLAVSGNYAYMTYGGAVIPQSTTWQSLMSVTRQHLVLLAA